jgi:hypothetical protein
VTVSEYRLVTGATSGCYCSVLGDAAQCGYCDGPDRS